MKEYLDLIFSATTTDDVCAALQKALDSLRAKNHLDKLPSYYEEIAARRPSEIEEWFDEMRNDEQVQEEGNLKEIFGLFDAALRQLRKLGFYRASS